METLLIQVKEKLCQNPTSEVLITGKQLFSISLIMYLYEMMTVHPTYCDNHLMYVNQIMICGL